MGGSREVKEWGSGMGEGEEGEEGRKERKGGRREREEGRRGMGRREEEVQAIP